MTDCGSINKKDKKEKKKKIRQKSPNKSYLRKVILEARRI